MGRDGTGRKGDGDAGFRFQYEVGGGGGSIRDSIRRCINATLSLLSLSFLGFPGLIEAARRAGERRDEEGESQRGACGTGPTAPSWTGAFVTCRAE
jgi:hypothetical protein